MQVSIKEVITSNKIKTYSGDVIKLIGLSNNSDELIMDIARTYLRDRLVDNCVVIELNHHNLIDEGCLAAYVYVKTSNNPEVYSMINKEMIVRGLCKYDRPNYYCKYANTFDILQSVAMEEERYNWSPDKKNLKYIGDYENI